MHTLVCVLDPLFGEVFRCTERGDLCTKIVLFMNTIAIFASGSGSNAEAIVSYFSERPDVSVGCILTNKADAGVIDRAKRLGVPCYYFDNSTMREGEKPLALLRELGVELIVLAGYLCLITPVYIEAFPQRIINIHPALLPRFGGKGMYGVHVHRAVIAQGESLSGITIHLVDELYDHGRHLLQATCPVHAHDTPETLAERIHHLEHRFFAPTIDHYLQNELR